MKSRRYTFFSVLFIVLVGLYVYSFQGESYTVDIVGLAIELPIAIWIILPLVVFYGLSTLHMLFYGFNSYLFAKKYENDYENMIALIKSRVLKEDKKYFDFKTKEYKNIGEFLFHLELNIKDTDFKSKELDLDDILSSYKKIENGDFVKDVDFKKDDPMYIKNIQNRLDKDSKFAFEVLKNASIYSEDITKDAFVKVIESLDKKDIFKYMENVNFDKELAFLIFDKYKNAELDLTIEEIKDIVSKAEFVELDFIKLANLLKSDFEPENLIAIFEALSNRFEKAEESYIYILLDLEMIEKAKDILDLANENEFLKLKAYLSLKEQGEYFNIELFI